MAFFNPEEVGFWVKMTLVVIFGLWGMHIGGTIVTRKNEPSWLHVAAFFVSLILVVTALVMFFSKYRWPASFDFVLVAALSLFVPAVLGLMIKAQEKKA